MARLCAFALLALFPFFAVTFAQTGGDKAPPKGDKQATEKVGEKKATDKGDKTTDKGDKKTQDKTGDKTTDKGGDKKTPDKGDKKTPDKDEKKTPDKTDKTQEKPEDIEFKADGTLSNTSPKYRMTGTASKSYNFAMKAGAYYTIRMKSDEVDAYLFLEDPKGKIVAEHDDEVPNKVYNAKIVYKCITAGDYKIICTCHPKSDNTKLKLNGKYTVTVAKSTKAEIDAMPKYQAPPEHEAMLGKPAPEIAGDFSVNGNALKLSDLKGKVVLVDFWAVWCGPCIATFPHLRDWMQEYRKDGLEIVGVTSYFKNLGFDKNTGKLFEVDEDTPLTAAKERDMVKDFAGHHQLNHQLLLIPNDSWKQAGKDYHIQGIPSAVLIDRTGNVRMIRVGSDLENAGDLEEGIRKLLAEK